MPCDWGYADELAEAIVDFARALLAAWLTPVYWGGEVTVITPVVTPTPTPVVTTVVVTAPAVAVVAETVVRTLTTTETVVRAETVTVTRPPDGYEVVRLATVGVVALAVGVALGYLARRS